MNPPFHYLDYEKQEIGVDTTTGRLGQVTIETCKYCSSRWLRYFVENEAFTTSGRWYRGWISEEMARTITPESAVEILQKLEWHFAGGSFFDSAGFKRLGSISLNP
jgi:hypothetical protein